MPDAIRVAQQQHQALKDVDKNTKGKKIGRAGFLQHKKTGDSANQPEENMNASVVATAGR